MAIRPTTPARIAQTVQETKTVTEAAPEPTADPRQEAALILAQVLCPRIHPEQWGDPATARIDQECLDIAWAVCGADWLDRIATYREQAAAVRALEKAADQVIALRTDLTEDPAPYAKAKEALQAQADLQRPPDTPPVAGDVSPATQTPPRRT